MEKGIASRNDNARAQAVSRGEQAVKAVPDGFHSVTPHVIVEGAADAIEFYKRAFGAAELGRLPMPGSTRLMHAAIKIGDSIVMLMDAMPEHGASGPKALGGGAIGLHIYSDDAERAFDRALKAGCTVTMPLADTFWGDRYGVLKDPFGHSWSIAQHIRDVSDAELAEGARQACPANSGATASGSH